MEEQNKTLKPIWNWGEYTEDYAGFYPMKNLKLVIYRQYTYESGVHHYKLMMVIEDYYGDFKSSNIFRFNACDMEQAIRCVERYLYDNLIYNILQNHSEYNIDNLMNNITFKACVHEYAWLKEV